MLKGSAELDSFCAGGSLFLNESGMIETRQKECNSKISNIEKWSDAFIIFMSIYLIRNKDEAPEMLTYMYNIREAASRKGGFAWRSYDEQFRLRQEINKSSWSVIITDLWWRCSLSNESFQSGQTNSNPAQRRLCLDYNKGQCFYSNCRYLHLCQTCNGSHSEVNCFKRQGNNQNQFPFRGPRQASRGRFPRSRNNYVRTANKHQQP